MTGSRLLNWYHRAERRLGLVRRGAVIATTEDPTELAAGIGQEMALARFQDPKIHQPEFHRLGADIETIRKQVNKRTRISWLGILNDLENC